MNMHKISSYPILDKISVFVLMIAALLLNTAQAETATLFDLSFDDLNGEEQSLASYRGKPMVINFWATWCPPCVKEMPDLDALSQSHPDVQFVGLAIDTKRNVKKFLERIPVSYDLYVPGHGGVKYMRELGNPKGGLPFTLVIAADGSTVERILGQIDKAELGAILDNLKN